MNTQHYEPHGTALLDYLRGDHAAVVTVHTAGAEPKEVPVSLFFRGPEAFLPLEPRALDLCAGRVLDMGGGAGCDALELQARGLDVCAIDILPACVEVMRARGVRDARVAEVASFDGGPFDTLLAMMNGLSLAAGLADLAPFLRRLRRLVRPGGRLVVDSCDLRLCDTERARGSMAWMAARGRYFGEMDVQLEYRGRRGPTFTQVAADPQTLHAHAAEAGWRCEIVEARPDGPYLAMLTAE